MQTELHILAGWLKQGHRGALATVTSTWGSAPRPVGSLLAVREDGEFEGSVSGGCVESAVIAASLEAIADGQSLNLSFGVSNEDAFAVGLACGGSIKIHVAPFQAQGAAFDDILARHAPEQPRLIIIGAVHIAQHLSEFAQRAGYDATIIDPRTAFATTGRFPNAALVTTWPDEALAALRPDANTAIVTLTHDPKLDDPALTAALASPAFYIAALGSRKTHAARRERLAAGGANAEALDRIEGPAGIAIGALSPAEIAISIMAGMTAARRRGDRLRQTLRLSAIVLAAGLSSRMAPRNKLLMPYEGASMITRAVSTVLTSQPREVIVVTGYQADEVRQALSGQPVRFVHNPAYADGMGSSLACGVRAVATDCDAVLVALGDMPDILPETIAQVKAAFDPRHYRSICLPVFAGQRGHPVLFDRMFFSALGQLDGDNGAKSVLSAWPDYIYEVTPEDPGVLLDIDSAPEPHYIKTLA